MGVFPCAFPLRCYAWFVGSLVRFLCVGYCLAQVVLLVPVLLGQCAPAFTAGLGAAGGGAVTYCCRSLSCDGHSPLSYAAAPAFSLRAISVWLECTSAEQSAVCFDPMGMSPSPFSNRVPCTHSLCRIPFLCQERSICAQSSAACSVCLDPLQLHCVSGLCLV